MRDCGVRNSARRCAAQKVSNFFPDDDQHRKLASSSRALGSGSVTPGFMTEGMGSPGRTEQRKKQNYSLFGVAFAQFPFIWWLCRV